MCLEIRNLSIEINFEDRIDKVQRTFLYNKQFSFAIFVYRFCKKSYETKFEKSIYWRYRYKQLKFFKYETWPSAQLEFSKFKMRPGSPFPKGPSSATKPFLFLAEPHRGAFLGLFHSGEQ